MKFINLARKNKTIDSASWEQLYKAKIVRRIRAKYSLCDEIAIIRQRDEKPEEYALYNAYVEECKATVKEIMK